MNTSFDILVIGLGCLLAIFLILSIIVVVLILRLVVALRQVVAKGEHLMDNAEAISDIFRQNAGAVGIVRVLMHFINNMGSSRRKR